MIIMLIFNSLMFLFLNHPLSKGLMLLMQTILTCLISGTLNYNFWYSYILFLIMIGGMLILFIYMTSIASNEKFKFNKKLFIIFMFFMLLFMIILYLDYFYFNFMSDIYMIKMKYYFNNKLSLLKYFNFPNMYIMILMILYLFITLIAVIKITNFSYGALRQKF